jgi:hypothetical protein
MGEGGWLDHSAPSGSAQIGSQNAPETVDGAMLSSKLLRDTVPGSLPLNRKNSPERYWGYDWGLDLDTGIF